jgi:hypothetical protein
MKGTMSAKSKSLQGKEKPVGLHPPGPLKLSTLAEVRGEMARLYRLALKGAIEADQASKFTYVLKEIRGCIEAETLDDIGARLTALTARVEARRHA